MKRSHWITLALFLAGLSGMIGAIGSWAEVLTPPFVAGVVGLGAAVINASFSDSPPETNAVTRTMGTVVEKISGTGD